MRRPPSRCVGRRMRRRSGAAVTRAIARWCRRSSRSSNCRSSRRYQVSAAFVDRADIGDRGEPVRRRRVGLAGAGEGVGVERGRIGRGDRGLVGAVDEDAGQRRRVGVVVVVRARCRRSSATVAGVTLPSLAKGVGAGQHDRAEDRRRRDPAAACRRRGWWCRRSRRCRGNWPGADDDAVEQRIIGAAAQQDGVAALDGASAGRRWRWRRGYIGAAARPHCRSNRPRSSNRRCWRRAGPRSRTGWCRDSRGRCRARHRRRR